MKSSATFFALAWASLYGAITASAVLWLDHGGNLLGGFAFALYRLPRQILLWLGAADLSRRPLLNALVAGLIILLTAFAFGRYGQTQGAERSSSTLVHRPLAAVALGLALTYEVVDLLAGDTARHALGSLRWRLFLPWHFAALIVTAAYVVAARKGVLPRWLRRCYWLVVFVMLLTVLFPMTDAM